MAHNKLTISIGTYNRPEFIQSQVRSVLKQLNERVALYVFDNASDTPVESLFTSEELKQFTLVRNRINIGRDQNQVRSIETVTEGWVWTLSDDDTIKDDAVQTALRIIDNHNDCCFINFGNKKESLITSYDELVDYFKILGSFGRSFFQSECLYNVDKIAKSIYWFNDFLSSQIGQICMVIKHMEKNPGEQCLFLTEHLVAHAEPGGWSPLALITNSSIIVDKFHYDKKRLRKNLFKALADMYLSMLSESKLKFSDGVYYLRVIRHKFGFFTLLRYNTIKLCEFLLKVIVPQKAYLLVRRFFAHKYNNSVK